MSKQFPAKIKNRLIIITLALVLIIGFYLRIGGVISSSFAYTYDVGRDMLSLQKISKLDVPLIGPTTGLAGLYYGPWWYYILTPAFIISNGNPQGVAVFMVLTGLLTIVLGYFLGKNISGKVLGLIISSFFAFSAVVVSFSNQIWNPNIIPPLVVFSFILLITLKEKKDFKRSLLLGLVLGLIFDLEIVFGVLFLIGFAISYTYIFKKKSVSFNAIFIFLGLFMVFSPRLFFEFRHQFVMTKSFFIDKGESQRIFDYQSFFSVFPERITTYISQLGDTFGVNFTVASLIIICTATIWIVLRKRTKKKELQVFNICLIILGVFIFGSSFFARAIWGHYIVGLPIIYVAVISLSILLLSRKSLKLSLLVLAVLLITSSKPKDLWRNFLNPNWEGDSAVYRNQVAVADFIYKEANGRRFNYITYTPVVHDYTYQYLLDWYGREKYKTIPSPHTENLLFVIIEPDPGFESRKTEWLKLREGDGRVISEKAVKGGIRVQTRKR